MHEHGEPTAPSAGPEPAESWRLEFDSSPVGVTVVSTDGRLLLLNEALAHLLGRTRDELVGMDFAAITHPDDIDADVRLFAEINRGDREGYRLAKRYLRSDGRVVWGDLTVTAVRSTDGSPAHYVSTVVDVTDQHRGRRRLDSLSADLVARTRLLERSNQDLHDFAAAVSHDLQNPLTALRGYLALMASHDEGWSAEQRSMLVERASTAAEEMSDLISSLLEFATVDPNPPTEEVDLRVVVARAVAALGDAAASVGGQIEVEDGDARVRGAETLLLTLVTNLAGNALKHRRPGTPPRIRIRTGHTLDSAGTGTSGRPAPGPVAAAVELVVADNGPGIRDEELARVTAMFSRGSDTVAHGYGIGLSTCRRIMAGHGGRLQLEHGPEGGLLVRCLFPTADGAPPTVS